MPKRVNIVVTAENKTKAALSGIQSGFQKVGKQLTGIGKKMTAGVTLPIVGFGIAAAKVAGDFESQMNVLAIAARGTGVSLDELRDAAIQVGADTELVGIDAAQAADAMTDMVKAGLDVTDIFGDMNAYLEEGSSLSGALRAAIDLQTASELDLAAASDIVTIAMATFGLEAEDAVGIADNFVRAADASVASVGELAAAMVNIGPTAAAFGWSLEETNTALAILSQRGIKGSEAGTALKSMMTNLMRPTDDVVATLEKLNVQLYDQAGAMLSLPDILGQLESGLAGATEEQRNMAIQTLAGTYGMKAMNTLLAEGMAGWEDMETAIANAASVQESAGARTKGLNAAMETLKGVIETFMIKAGTPLIENVLTPLIQKVTGFAEKLVDLDPKIIEWGLVIGGVVAAAGPLITIVGVLATAVGALLSPVGLVIAAIVALGVGFVALDAHIRKVRDAMQTQRQAVLEASGTYEEYKQAMVDILRAQESIPNRIDDAAVALQAQARGLILSQAAWDTMRGKYDDVGVAAAMLEAKTKLLGEAAFGLAPAVTSAATATEGFFTQLGAGIDKVEALRARFVAQQEAFAQLTASTEAEAARIETAWITAFGSEEIQVALDTMQQVFVNHQSAMTSIAERGGMDVLNVQFNADLQAQIARAKHQAQMAQMEQVYQLNLAQRQEAGNVEAAARLMAAHQTEVAEAEQHFAQSQARTSWNEKIQQQVRERSQLIQRIAQQKTFIAELEQQWAYIEASLAGAVTKAQEEGKITLSAAKAVLNVIGTANQEKLLSEYGYVESSLELAKNWASGQIGSVQAAVGAYEQLKKAMEGQIEAAKDSLDAMQKALADFKVDLPPLKLPPLPSLAETGAKLATETKEKIKEPIQKALADVTAAMAKGIDAAKKAIEQLVGFELPEGFEAGLSVFKDVVIRVSRAMHDVWVAAQEQLESAAKASPGIKAIGEAFGAMMKAIKSVTAEDEFAEGGFAEALTRSIERMKLTGMRIMDWLKQIDEDSREMVAEAGPVAENIKKLFNVIGVDLSKIVPAKDLDQFGRDVVMYFIQMEHIGVQTMNWIGRIDENSRETLAAAAPVAENIKKVLSIIGIDLSKIAAPEEGWEQNVLAYFQGVESVTDVALEVLQRIQDKWGAALPMAAETMGNVAGIWRGVAEMTKAIEEAAELGGPDIGAANAMAGMAGEIMYGKPGQVGGAAGAMPGAGGGGGQVNLNIGNMIIDIAGVGTFETGEISISQAAAEGQAIDLRLQATAKSV